MTTRVVIEGGSDRPFIISRSGVDANGAPYYDVIFDGNFYSLPVLTDGTFANNHSWVLWLPDEVISYGGLNSAALGKTFPTPPLCFMYSPVTSRNWVEWNAGASEFQVATISARHSTGHYCSIAAGNVDGLMAFTDEDTLYSPRAGSWVVFDRAI